MSDFEQEFECYTQVKKVVTELEKVKLQSDIVENLVACYQQLVEAGIVPEEELHLLDYWTEDFKML